MKDETEVCAIEKEGSKMDRTRRLRQTVALRNMVRENHVRVDELIYPLFVMEGENLAEPVESMPGICQYSLDRMNEELDRVKEAGIPAILIFGIPAHKDEVGSGAYDEHGRPPCKISFAQFDSIPKYGRKVNSFLRHIVADFRLFAYVGRGEGRGHARFTAI